MCCKIRTIPNSDVSMKKLLTRCLDGLHSFSVKKLLLILGSVIAVLAIALCSVMLYRDAQKRDLAYVVQQINFAIASNNLELLEPYVDFLEMGKAFAVDLHEYQGRHPDEKESMKITEQLQVLVLAGFRTGDETPEGKAKEGGKEDSAEKTSSVSKNVAPPVLPPDLMTQLRAHPFRIQGSDGHVGILTSPIRHRALDYATELKLVARLEDSGWKIVGVANARELLAGNFAARKKLYESHVQAFLSENIQRDQLMNSHCFITDCRVFLARRESRDDSSLVINVEGYNMGTKNLLSSGFRCYLKNSTGKVLAVLPLNSTRKVGPSDFFQQNWQVELSEAFPETSLLLREEKLQCVADVTSVSIGSGQIVFLRPAEELEEIRKTFDPAYVPAE